MDVVKDIVEKIFVSELNTNEVTVSITEDNLGYRRLVLEVEQEFDVNLDIHSLPNVLDPDVVTKLVKEFTMADQIEFKQVNVSGEIEHYQFSRMDGTEIDDNFEGFVIRLDEGAEPNHRRAGLRAVMAYAEEIAKTEPALAEEIRERYSEAFSAT